MQPGEAFDITLREFGIKAIVLSRKAEVHESQINRLRHNKVGMSYLEVQKLIDALPKEAMKYYYSLILASRGLMEFSISKELPPEYLVSSKTFKV